MFFSVLADMANRRKFFSSKHLGRWGIFKITQALYAMSVKTPIDVFFSASLLAIGQIDVSSLVVST